MTFRKLAAGLMASGLLFAGAAAARDLPDGGVSPGEVVDALQDKGLQAELGRDSAGDPKITSSVDGVKFWIYFYGCKSSRCSSIQFVAGFDLKSGSSLGEMNVWNRDYRFGMAYLDNENDPHIKLDLDVEHGATAEALTNVIERWGAVLTTFKKHINW